MVCFVRRCAASSALCALLCFASVGSTAEKTLDAVPVDGKTLRFDGLLKEWPELVELSEKVSGSGSTGGAAGAVSYDAKHLYVGMRIKDANFIRTSNFGTAEDHAELVIAFPSRSGAYKSYGVKLYPGQPGKSAGAVKIAGLGKVPGSKIVEAPMEGGFTFEAQIPWAAFPEANSVRTGLRGALRYHDVDAGGRATVQATSKAKAEHLPPLTIEAEYALRRALLQPKGLDTKPDKQLVGNVVGDSTLETVAIYDRYLAVTGWKYRGGKEFYFQDLKLLNPGDLKRFELVDVNGDGYDEVVIHRRVGTSGDAREYFEIWQFRSEKDAPQPLFQHEVGITQGLARIENAVELKKTGSSWSVNVKQGKHSGITINDWTGPTASGDRATLLPWEAVESRHYAWKGQGFELVEEKEGKPQMEGPAGGQRMVSAHGPADDAGPGGMADAVPAPRPPTAEELLDQVYALYRADRGVKKAAPRFDFVTNVAGDSRNERVLVHGKDIVVFGKGFKGGTSYVYTTIGVKEPEHVLHVTARNVIGAGHAEIVVQAIIPAQASEQLGGATVLRHALFIYRVTENGIERIFAAETGRSLEDAAILARVAFIPAGSGMKLELSPGRAVGWTKKTYPFPEDKLPYGGLEPLLLPWTELGPRTYVFRGSAFERVE